MKNSSIHSRWLAYFVSSVLLVILLWQTGHLNFLISKDALGAGFSIFLVLTLLNAAYSQFQSFKNFDKSEDAVQKVHTMLKDDENYETTLASFIQKGDSGFVKGTPLGGLFFNLRRFIHLNKQNPITETNLESCEVAVDEAFHMGTSNELEQAQTLVILGMLGTFVGILWGFASVNWATVTSENAFVIVIGVMKGVGIAFITSVLGGVFSLFLKKMHKRLEATHRTSFMLVATDIQDMSRVLCHKESYERIAKQVTESNTSEAR